MRISATVNPRFLERIDHHIGGLVRFKRKIWWLNKKGIDDLDNRVCLLIGYSTDKIGAPTAKGVLDSERNNTFIIGVIIDEENVWIWANESDVELIDELR
jgi:hypothetical protein